MVDLLLNGPSRPDANFVRVVNLLEKVENEKITTTIPKELYEPRLGRSMFGFLASYALYGLAVGAVAVAPHWLLWIPLWIAAGLGGWGLHCIAHDCGHGSFARSKRINNIVGHLSLLPMVYPFHAWRHVHNMHHGSTNNIETDTDWRPIDIGTYRRMPFLDRVNYFTNRTILFWFGTGAYMAKSAFSPKFFPQASARAEVRRSMLFTLAVCGAYIGALIWFTGFVGVLKYFVAPWLAMHVWFSITTLMHHTAEDLPFLTRAHWKRKGSRLMTIDYLYPKWLLFFTHHISIHTAHHVAPGIPSYNLVEATGKIKEAFPGYIQERKFTWGQVWRIVTRCHFYDPETGYYHSVFSAPRETAAPPAKQHA